MPAAVEIARRITARGGDASRIATTGDLIYAASASEADRQEPPAQPWNFSSAAGSAQSAHCRVGMGSLARHPA
jgi:hypothetical protein